MAQLTMKEVVEDSLRQHVERLREEVLQEALEAANSMFEQRLRNTLATAAVKVADMFSMESLGQVLHVRIQDTRQGGN